MVNLLNSVFWSLSRKHLCSSSGFEERCAVLASHVVLVFAIGVEHVDFFLYFCILCNNLADLS